MENFLNYFKKEKWMRSLLLFGVVLLISFPSYAGSVKEVSQNIKQVQSIEPPYQFAIIGDSRSGEKVYTQLIKRIFERKPNFLIHLGDMINIPHEKEWRRFFELSKEINVPFFPAAGNHDVGFTRLGQEMYRKHFFLPDEMTYYSFRAGGGLFIILDSEMSNRKIVGEQRTWLENILLSSKEKYKLIFVHSPLFLPMDSLRSGGAMDKYPLDRDDLHQLFLKTKVKGVFAADDHRYDRREIDDILYVISGGGGAPLTSLKERGGYFHYIWVSAQKGKIEGEVVDLEGQIQDRFVIE